MKIRNAGGTVIAILPFGRDLDAYYAEYGLDPVAHSVEYSAEEQRQLTRRSIYNVADLPSLVGITADGVAIALHMLAKLSKALSTASDVSDLRTALSGFETEMSAYAEAIDAGTVRLPYLAKGGLGVVMPEIQNAGTAVADVFTA